VVYRQDWPLARIALLARLDVTATEVQEVSTHCALEFTWPRTVSLLCYRQGAYRGLSQGAVANGAFRPSPRSAATPSAVCLTLPGVGLAGAGA